MPLLRHHPSISDSSLWFPNISGHPHQPHMLPNIPKCLRFSSEVRTSFSNLLDRQNRREKEACALSQLRHPQSAWDTWLESEPKVAPRSNLVLRPPNSGEPPFPAYSQIARKLDQASFSHPCVTLRKINYHWNESPLGDSLTLRELLGFSAQENPPYSPHPSKCSKNTWIPELAFTGV